MFQSLANGNKASVTAAFGVHRGNDDTLEKPERDIARLTVVLPRVFDGNQGLGYTKQSFIGRVDRNPVRPGL